MAQPETAREPLRTILAAVTRQLYIAKSEREYELLGLDAEARYLRFRERFGEHVASLVQRHVASYLGVTPEYLSRVRSRLKIAIAPTTPLTKSARGAGEGEDVVVFDHIEHGDGQQRGHTDAHGDRGTPLAVHVRERHEERRIEREEQGVDRHEHAQYRLAGDEAGTVVVDRTHDLELLLRHAGGEGDGGHREQAQDAREGERDRQPARPLVARGRGQRARA